MPRRASRSGAPGSEEVDPDSSKIVNMYATFSIAAVSGEFWQDLKPEDFA
jgi:hypothetical protein